MEVKKGVQNNATDEDIGKEAKRLLEENTKDRKDLKDVEDQKNLIRKVLLKIKAAMNESSAEGEKTKVSAN